MAELVETGAVDTVDLKGLYKGSVVDNPADPALYRLVAEGFPDAWIEDPAITEETWPVLEPYQDRITWDGNIHSRRRHRLAAVPTAHGQRQALAPRRPASAVQGL